MFAAAFPPGPAWGSSDILVHWYSADGLSDWAPVQEIVNFHQTGGLWYDPVSPMPFQQCHEPVGAVLHVAGAAPTNVECKFSALNYSVYSMQYCSTISRYY